MLKLKDVWQMKFSVWTFSPEKGIRVSRLGRRYYLKSVISKQIHWRYKCWTSYVFFSDAQEFCEGESFSGQCSRDEVVVLQSAQYGRMQLGRCVQMNMGYIGCTADVLGLADTKCSGRRSCTLNVPDTDFERTRPCFELKSYLQVSHTCIRGNNWYLWCNILTTDYHMRLKNLL